MMKMLTGVVRVGFLLALLLALAGGAALLAGRAQPVHPGLAGIGAGCEALDYRLDYRCWNGIILGSTTAADAAALLAAQGYAIEWINDSYLYFTLPPGAAGCWDGVYQAPPSPSGIRLRNARCPALRLGDLLPFLGAPLRMDASCADVAVDFRNATVAVGEGRRARVSPHSSVLVVFLRPRSNSGTGDAWHGFISFNVYVRLEPRADHGCGIG